MAAKSARVRILGVAVTLLVSAGALAGCAGLPSADPAPDAVPLPQTSTDYGDVEAGPGAFIVRYADTEMRLAPAQWSLEDESSRADFKTPPSVGGAEKLYVFVPVTGWHLYAFTYTGPNSHACDSVVLDADIEDLGGGWSVIRPRGSDGTYTLELAAASGPWSGLFPTIGDMTGRVTWDVSDAEQPPLAAATVSLVADVDGTTEAWDLIVQVTSLYPPTRDVSATVTVTSAEGRSAVFDTQPLPECDNQGAFLSVPADQTQGVLSLGSLPFTYTVVLVVDGKTYVGTAQYTTGPTSLPLEFTPALP